MRLDLADLKLFLCVVRAGSISAGALEANLALSSASERLRHMELDLGMSLLVRHPRGVVPTKAGELLLTHAQQIIQQHEALKAELRHLRLGNTSTLKLYVNTSAFTEFLPQKITSWLKNHPDFQIDLEEQHSSEIIKIISTGLGEAGIVSNAVNPQTLELKPILDDHLVLIVPEHHHLRETPSILFKDIVQEAFVGLYAASALQKHINSHAHDLGYQLNFRIQVNNFESMCEMVSNTIGLAILPKTIADKYQSKFKYQQIILLDAWTKRQLCLVYRSWDTLNPMMKDLLMYLQNDHKS